MFRVGNLWTFWGSVSQRLNLRCFGSEFRVWTLWLSVLQGLSQKDLSMYDEDVRDLNSLNVCVLNLCLRSLEVYAQAMRSLSFLRVLSQDLTLRYSLTSEDLCYKDLAWGMWRVCLHVGGFLSYVWSHEHFEVCVPRFEYELFWCQCPRYDVSELLRDLCPKVCVWGVWVCVQDMRSRNLTKETVCPKV